MIDFSVDDRDLQKALKRLERKLQAKIMRGAIRKSGRPVVLGARQRVPRRSGDLAKSMGTQVITGQKNIRGVGRVGTLGEITIRVGPRISGRYDGFYGDFVERGTRYAAAQPFLRPAFDVSVDDILRILADEGWKRIEVEVVRAGGSRR